MRYNSIEVRTMKDKILQIRADAQLLAMIEYLRRINGFKTVSETVRKIIEKEWRKEHETD